MTIQGPEAPQRGDPRSRGSGALLASHRRPPPSPSPLSRPRPGAQGPRVQGRCGQPLLGVRRPPGREPGGGSRQRALRPPGLCRHQNAGDTPTLKRPLLLTRLRIGFLRARLGPKGAFPGPPRCGGRGLRPPSARTGGLPAPPSAPPPSSPRQPPPGTCQADPVAALPCPSGSCFCYRGWGPGALPSHLPSPHHLPTGLPHLNEGRQAWRGDPVAAGRWPHCWWRWPCQP